MKILIGTVLILGLLFGTHYKVDQANSLVAFKIRHAVVAKVEGKFNEFWGEYEYDDKLNYFKSFEGEAKMASVDTDEKYRDEHLRSKLFDVEHYPTMKLVMTKQDGSLFRSNLTIKGVTKEVDFTIGRSTQQEKRFLLMGEISRKDFNLTFSDMAELGGVAVGDTVKINIMFSGIAQE